MKSHEISTTHNLENKIKEIIDQYAQHSQIQKTVKLMKHTNLFLTYPEIRFKKLKQICCFSKLINLLHMKEYQKKE